MRRPKWCIKYHNSDPTKWYVLSATYRFKRDAEIDARERRQHCMIRKGHHKFYVEKVPYAKR
jgi:hypothetical protein